MASPQEGTNNTPTAACTPVDLARRGPTTAEATAAADPLAGPAKSAPPAAATATAEAGPSAALDRRGAPAAGQGAAVTVITPARVASCSSDYATSRSAPLSAGFAKRAASAGHHEAQRRGKSCNSTRSMEWRTELFQRQRLPLGIDHADFTIFWTTGRQ